MLLDYQKELTPVLYGGSAVKVLDIKIDRPAELLFGTHWHERMELLLITEGEISLNFGEDEFAASAGELVIIPPGQPHRGISARAPLHYYAVMFDPALFISGVPALSDFLKELSIRGAEFERVTARPELISSARALTEEYFRGGKDGEISAAAEVYRLIALMHRFCFISSAQPSGSDLRFKEIISYVDENFREDISCSSLSRKFGYDEAYFSRKFKEVTGLSPTVYIRVLRLEYAQKLLKKGVSVSDAAHSCGFSDAGYFSRCFKKQFSMTPTEYILKG